MKIKKYIFKRNKSVPLFKNGFSMRKILTSYNGYCLRIKRSSDNVEMDIGFVNGFIDTATMLSFIGVNDGYLVEWYNQGYGEINIGSNNNGCNLVTSGVLETFNGIACIRRNISNSNSIYYKGIYGIRNSIDAYDFTEIFVGSTEYGTIGCTTIGNVFATGYGHYRSVNGNQVRHNSTTVTYPNTSWYGATKSISCFNQNLSNYAMITLNGVDSDVVFQPGIWNIGFSIDTNYIQELLTFDFSANDISITKQKELSDEVNLFWNYY